MYVFRSNRVKYVYKGVEWRTLHLLCNFKVNWAAVKLSVSLSYVLRSKEFHLSTSYIFIRRCFQIASKNETGNIGDTQDYIKLLILLWKMVPPHGLEPRTPWLQIRCSTSWAIGAISGVARRLTGVWRSGKSLLTGKCSFFDLIAIHPFIGRKRRRSYTKIRT